MKIKNEYRLIHPRRIFSILLEILNEYSQETEKKKSTTETTFKGMVKSSFSDPEEGDVQIHAKLDGKKKTWKHFEPFSDVWRVTLTLDIQGGRKIAEEIKEKFFYRTLRAGG